MMKYFLLFPFLFCLSAFSDKPFYTEFSWDCETRQRLWVLRNPDERTISTFSTHKLLFYLGINSFKLVMDCARILNSDNQPDSEKQIACLNNLLTDQSYDFIDLQDRIILSYMRDNFQSLGGVLIAYNNEKDKCKQYYSYGSLGFCIPFTGKECLDRQATIRVYEKHVIENVKNAMGGRTGLNLPGTCVIRQFLTPQGKLTEEVLWNRSFGCPRKR